MSAVIDSDVEQSGTRNTFRERIRDEQVDEDVQLAVESAAVFSLLMMTLNWKINDATYSDLATSVYIIAMLLVGALLYFFGHEHMARNMAVRMITAGVCMYTCFMVVEMIT